jgi:hypothetical protein
MVGLSMSIVSLLHYPDDERGQANFSFDHAAEHDKLTFSMAQPTLFNIANYLLDPMPAAAMVGAGNWAQDHQQAHDDAGAWFGQPSMQLVDTSGSAGSLQQWLFVNQVEHSTLAGAALASSD